MKALLSCCQRSSAVQPPASSLIPPTAATADTPPVLLQKEANVVIPPVVSGSLQQQQEGLHRLISKEHGVTGDDAEKGGVAALNQQTVDASSSGQPKAAPPTESEPVSKRHTGDSQNVSGGGGGGGGEAPPSPSPPPPPIDSCITGPTALESADGAISGKAATERKGEQAVGRVGGVGVGGVGAESAAREKEEEGGGSRHRCQQQQQQKDEGARSGGSASVVAGGERPEKGGDPTAAEREISAASAAAAATAAAGAGKRAGRSGETVKKECDKKEEEEDEEEEEEEEEGRQGGKAGEEGGGGGGGARARAPASGAADPEDAGGGESVTLRHERGESGGGASVARRRETMNIEDMLDRKWQQLQHYLDEEQLFKAYQYLLLLEQQVEHRLAFVAHALRSCNNSGGNRGSGGGEPGHPIKGIEEEAGRGWGEKGAVGVTNTVVSQEHGQKQEGQQQTIGAKEGGGRVPGAAAAPAPPARPPPPPSAAVVVAGNNAPSSGGGGKGGGKGGEERGGGAGGPQSEDELSEMWQQSRLTAQEHALCEFQKRLVSEQPLKNLRTQMAIFHQMLLEFHLDHLLQACEEPRLSCCESLVSTAGDSDQFQQQHQGEDEGQHHHYHHRGGGDGSRSGSDADSSSTAAAAAILSGEAGGGRGDAGGSVGMMSPGGASSNKQASSRATAAAKGGGAGGAGGGGAGGGGRLGRGESFLQHGGSGGSNSSQHKTGGGGEATTTPPPPGRQRGGDASDGGAGMSNDNNSPGATATATAAAGGGGSGSGDAQCRQTGTAGGEGGGGGGGESVLAATPEQGVGQEEHQGGQGHTPPLLSERRLSSSKVFRQGLRSVVGRKMSFGRKSGGNLSKRSAVKRVVTARKKQDDEGWLRERGHYLDISYRVEKDSSVSMKVRGKLPCMLFQVLAILNETDLAGTWAPFFKSGEKEYQYTKASQLVRQVYDYPLLGNKETLLFCVGVNALEEGGCVCIFCRSPPENATEFMGLPLPVAGSPPPGVGSNDANRGKSQSRTSWAGGGNKLQRIQSADLVFLLFPISEGRQTTLELFGNFHHGLRFVPMRLITFVVKKIVRSMFVSIARQCQDFQTGPYKERVEKDPVFYGWMERKIEEYFQQRRKLGSKPAFLAGTDSAGSLASFNYEEFQD